LGRGKLLGDLYNGLSATTYDESCQDHIHYRRISVELVKSAQDLYLFGIESTVSFQSKYFNAPFLPDSTSAFFSGSDKSKSVVPTPRVRNYLPLRQDIEGTDVCDPLSILSPFM